MPKIVELIGTPGAGKTSLLPAVQSALQARGIRAYTVLEASRPFARRTAVGRIIAAVTPGRWEKQMLWQVFYYLSYLNRIQFALQHPRLIRSVVSSQRQRSNQAELREQQILHWFYYLIGSYQFLKDKAQADETLLFDEGFAHRVVQFNASDREPLSKENILTYLDLIPKPDLLIHIQASPETCQDRIRERGVWEFFQHKNEKEISHFIHHADRAVNIAVDYFRQNRWPLVEVKNDGSDISSVAKSMNRRLGNFFGEKKQVKLDNPATVI